MAKRPAEFSGREKGELDRSLSDGPAPVPAETAPATFESLVDALLQPNVQPPEPEKPAPVQRDRDDRGERPSRGGSRSRGGRRKSRGGGR